MPFFIPFYFFRLQTHGTGALVVLAMLDFLTFALCAPYSETTDGAHFDRLLEMVAENGRSLYRLFQHPSLAIVKVSVLSLLVFYCCDCFVLTLYKLHRCGCLIAYHKVDSADC